MAITSESAALGQHFSRTRLLDQLERAVSGSTRIIWIGARAGSGKTTLLNQFAEQTGRPCLWYQLDETDQDLNSFLHRFTQIAESVLPAKEPRPMWRPGVSAVAFIRLYVRALHDDCTSPTPVLMLDDAHALESNHPLFEVIAAAAEEWPESGALLIASRHDPPPSLRRLQAYDSLWALQQSDLNLTQEAVGPFCKQLMGKLSGEVILDSLYHLTRGWLTGLMLTARSTQQEGPGILRVDFDVGRIDSGSSTTTAGRATQFVKDLD